ncbi:MAG: hypothetical protein M5U28_00520 [Sandaracinaceae bacterium]|nr:hypothetical protein [Sandaracinaceae bacterium]
MVVVPTLLPKITQSARGRSRMPAFTKPIVATVTALDDWTTAVITTPAPKARSLVRVQRARRSRSMRPAATFRPSVIMRIPSRKSPRPPMKAKARDQALMRASG